MLNLYKNIRQRRIDLGLSQSELAKKVGYSDKSMISRIENGIIDLPQSKIIEFANILNTTPGALLGWDIDMDQSYNNGTISNNINSPTSTVKENHTNNTYTTTNNYYSSPCKQTKLVNHDIKATIESKELFFEMVMLLKDMTDEQLKDMIKYADFLLKR